MSSWILVFAMGLDAVFGEPKWLWNRFPHPAVVMGRMIQWADDRFNSGTAQRAKGVVLVCALLVFSKIVADVIAILPLSHFLEIILVAILLAQKSLCEHVLAVARGLTGSVSEGRKAVAMIVGRDTKDMDEAAIGRSAIESGAENLSDGVIAPVLFFLAFGLPGILAYKFINTADSMIGYRTPRHEEFGWAAARLDDVFNYIPARATALVIALLSGTITSWGEIAKDARLHRSPNAGWPEAAMARALGVALSGPRSYEGQMRDFAFVNSAGRHDIMPSDIRKSVTWLWRVWGAFLAIALVVALVT